MEDQDSEDRKMTARYSIVMVDLLFRVSCAFIWGLYHPCLSHKALTHSTLNGSWLIRAGLVTRSVVLFLGCVSSLLHERHRDICRLMPYACLR
jgi:hypothetical protein